MDATIEKLRKETNSTIQKWLTSLRDLFLFQAYIQAFVFSIPIVSIASIKKKAGIPKNITKLYKLIYPVSYGLHIERHICFQPKK